MIKEKKGGEAVAYYIIVLSPEIDALRSEAGLPPHALHITLGFSPNDVHGVSKGIETTVIKALV